jgi:hypothetical protein
MWHMSPGSAILWKYVSFGISIWLTFFHMNKMINLFSLSIFSEYHVHMCNLPTSIMTIVQLLMVFMCFYRMTMWWTIFFLALHYAFSVFSFFSWFSMPKMLAVTMSCILIFTRISLLWFIEFKYVIWPNQNVYSIASF